MSDLISRQAAIDALGEEPELWDDWTDEYNLGQRNLWRAATKAIKDLPSVQPERKKGEWIRPFGAQTSSYRFLCSECGEIAYQVTGNCGRKYKIPQKCTYKWCPNCGAEMTEGEDDGNE